MFLHSFGCLFFQATFAVVSPTALRNRTVDSTEVGALDACKDFSTGEHSDLAWTLDDCNEVWTQFVDTISPERRQRMGLVEVWRDTASRLREQGTPCLAASTPTADGVGSSTIRLLASWIFAEEMGCDWVTPDWGREHVDGENGTEYIWYCHFVETLGERRKEDTKKVQDGAHCSVVDWLGYFQFAVASVSLPVDGRSKIIPVRGC